MVVGHPFNPTLGTPATFHSTNLGRKAIHDFDGEILFYEK
jgi:hypothetical protein